MPIEALDRLAFEIKHTMQDRFGLEFCRVNPARSVCDREYKQLEEAREARLQARDERSAVNSQTADTHERSIPKAPHQDAQNSANR